MLEQDYYEHFAESLSDAELLRRLDGDSDEMLRFAPLLGEVPLAGTLLDVGCGPGVLLAKLRQQRPQLRAVGLERSRRLADAGRRLFGIHILPGNIECLPVADRAFDVVVACEVLEHLPHGVYERALDEIQRVARSTILVTVPFRERRESAICPCCNCRFDLNYHMRRFDEPALRGLLTDFLLTRTVPIVVRRSLLAGIAETLRRARRVLTGNTDFPCHALCPQCGYFAARDAGEPAGFGRRKAPGTSLKDAIRSRLPTIPTIRWMMAVYQRSREP